MEAATDVEFFKWRIPDFLQTIKTIGPSSSMSSPVYTFENHQWQIDLYPHGNVEKGYMALFLKWLSTESPKPAEPLVKFSVMLTNPLLRKDYIECCTNILRRFSARYNDWGWNCFCPLLEADPTRGFIDPDDGSITLQLAITSKTTACVAVYPVDTYLLVGTKADMTDPFDLTVNAGGRTFNCHQRLFNQHCASIDLPECRAEVFQIIHDFIYTGVMSIRPFGDLNTDKVLYQLVVTADKFDLDTVIKRVPVTNLNCVALLNAAMATGNISLKEACLAHIKLDSHNYSCRMPIDLTISFAALLAIISEFVVVYSDTIDQVGTFSKTDMTYPIFPSADVKAIARIASFIVEWVLFNHAEKYIPILKSNTGQLFQRVNPTAEFELLYRDDWKHDAIMDICRRFVQN